MPAAAATAEQEETFVGPVVAVVQLVVVQEFPEAATAEVQDATPVGPVVTVAQVTVGDAVQLETPTGVVQPQVVVVQLLPEPAVAAEQPSGTEVGPVVTTGQVVVI